MKILNYNKSKDLIIPFLEKIKRDAATGEMIIEYFILNIQEPHTERFECAYIQAKDKKQGLLYEAITQSLFMVGVEEIEDKEIPVLFKLDRSIANLLKVNLKNSLSWVCTYKKDKVLNVSDFGDSFSLEKPTII